MIAYTDWAASGDAIMRHLTWSVALLAAGLIAGGCEANQYSSRTLANVGYADAFRAGKTVLARHFSIAAADEVSGKIVSRPTPVEGARDRLIGVSSARQIATLRIRQKGQNVLADVRVDVQRQELAAFRHMQPVTVNNELPHQTPALDTAAVTPEQDQAWQDAGRNEAKEQEILEGLARELSRQK